MYGLRKPKKVKILGLDIAGTVESVGKDVKRFQVGDEVFGDISGSMFGGFAEYTCASEDALTLKPASMSFEQAAAIPHVAVLGLQGLFFKGEVKSGEKILMNGAGGGLGTLVVQVAKSLGAEVTEVDIGMKLDMLRSLGADHVIDYTKEDFTRNGLRYDRIIDVAGFHPIFAYKRALASGGTYGMIGGATSRVMQTLALGPIIALLGSKKMGVVMHKANKDMDYVIELFEDGKLVPVIDRTYPLDEVPDALRFFGEAKSQGKILIKI
jgi:NADPH:quinone reductase-like Zn-dependent oxidoreductase